MSRDNLAPGKSSARQNEYLTAVAGVAVLTIACWAATPLTGYAAIALIFLLGVLLAAMVLSRGPVLLVATLSALSWNFLFIPPRFTLHIAKLEDALMFATYFIVAVAVGTLTARLREREHLAAQIRVAEESERLRKSLLDCVSHELKTPVAVIHAASEALVRASGGANNSELGGELAAEIKAAARRLNGTVDSLLDMTRLESGVISPKREWCELRELVQTAVELEKQRLGERSVAINVSENTPLVLVDERLLAQALAKLVANAASYTAADVPIAISADCQGGSLVLSVTDAGPGIARGEEERVFEKFYRGADAKGTAGLGLGLSIARGFVEAHGGKLTAENASGGGARFTITVPTPMKDARALEAVS